MMKYFTAYKVNFSRRELGLGDGDMLGNPYLSNSPLKRVPKPIMGSHISEEDDDELRSTRSKFLSLRSNFSLSKLSDSFFKNRNIDDDQRN